MFMRSFSETDVMTICGFRIDAALRRQAPDRVDDHDQRDEGGESIVEHGESWLLK
jgi:hypothetical protein